MTCSDDRMSGVLPADARDERAVVVRMSADLRAFGAGGLSAGRLLLVADVLRRCTEFFDGHRVLLAVVGGHAVRGAPDVRRLGLAEPAFWVADPDEASAALGAPPDLVVAAAEATATGADGSGQRFVRVGAVLPASRVGDRLDELLSVHDPSVLRLALLRFPCHRNAELSAARLHRADQTIERWRYKVALWSELPAAAAVPELVATARRAIAAGADTPAVLQELHRLEVDPAVASGAKFATFERLDRVLRLDLGRLVGKLRH